MNKISDKYILGNSLDWDNIRSSFVRKIHVNIPREANRSDLYTILHNLDDRITSLSKAEVLARRGNKSQAEILLKLINEEIEHLNELIVVAALIG